LRGSSSDEIANIGVMFERRSKRPPTKTNPSLLPNAGGCDFVVNPELRGDKAAPIWLTRLDPNSVIIAPAPAFITDAANVGALTPALRRPGSDGNYVLIDGAGERFSVVLTDGAGAATPAAIVIPLDAQFAARANAAVRLWRLATGQPSRRPPDLLTSQRRQRLILALRALDGHQAGESYRAIAQGLFGANRVPNGSAWKTHDLRDRTIRLVRYGSSLMEGGYLDLLR
jgi:hypothetical protein